MRSQPYGPWKTRLGLGQWCQVRYNGRIVTETTWRYHITTVNIGVFARVTEDAFLAGPATTRYEDLVELR